MQISSRSVKTFLAQLKLVQLEDRSVPALGLDTTFGSGGTVSNPAPAFTGSAVVASAADGAVIVAGNFAPTSGQATDDLGVVRLNSAGSPDPQFGDAGMVRLSFLSNSHLVSAAAVLSTGKILLAGEMEESTGTRYC
jgi:hypothetical protein